MPMELRKRKAPPPPPPSTGKKPTKIARTASAVQKTVKGKAAEVAASTNGSGSAATKPAVGDTINLDGFGGEIETNDGTKTTLKTLVDESKAGVVLFTYPKASTPGCTKQACLFRDAYDGLTGASGLAIYGLSADSPKANTTFKEKQRLPYPLLCDAQATLIAAIGLKKSPKGTTRGVFVVDKAGKVLAAQAGSPEGTVSVVREIVGKFSAAGAGGEAEKGENAADAPVAEAEKAAPAANGDGKAEEKVEGEGEGEKKE